MNPKISIIIPFYNNPHQLKIALTSIYNQTYKNFEVIVVDDGSVNDYKKMVFKYAEEFNLDIKYIKQKNQGPGVARQNGLNVATGKYIQYLDSDDEILPQKLVLQVTFFDKNPTAIMVYGLSQINGDSSKIHRKTHFKGNEAHVSISAIQKRKWHTSSCLWNYDTKNIYWEDLTNGEDVLHDVNAGIYNANTNVIFHHDIVSNINMSDGDNHLSNSIKNANKHDKLVRDATELNNRIFEKINKNGLLENKIARESLAERYLYEGLKFYKLNYTSEGKEMLNKGFGITNKGLKKIEIVFCNFLANSNMLSSKAIHYFFKIHRVLNHKDLHQYRSL